MGRYLSRFHYWVTLVSTRVWEDISLDFITGLPRSKGNDAYFLGLRHPYTVKTVAVLFAKEIIRLHEMPKSIVSDQDSIFLIYFWSELFRLQGTQLKMSAAYHPETDGQTEMLNRSIETYLYFFTSKQPKYWSKWFAWAEYWYNSSFHTAAGMTPFRSSIW